MLLLAAVAVVTARNPAPAGDTYASTDFAGGGYHAWSTLLDRERVAVTRFVLRPIELDGRIDTLISAQPLPAFTDPAVRTAADLASMAAWVRAGGRLVYIGRHAGLAKPERALLELPLLLRDVGTRGKLRGSYATLVGTVERIGADRMLLVEHSGRAELSDRNGDIVVRYPLGRGEVVAVVDTVPFDNANIAAGGNARLAYLIGVPRRSGGVVAFDDGIHGALIDRPWYRALGLPTRVALSIVAVAGLLAFIGGLFGSGPPMRLSPEREPTSVEFLDALASLYERTQARATASALVAAGSAAPSTDAQLLTLAQHAYAQRKDSDYDGARDGRRTAFAGRTRTRRRR